MDACSKNLIANSIAVDGWLLPDETSILLHLLSRMFSYRLSHGQLCIAAGISYHYLLIAY